MQPNSSQTMSPQYDSTRPSTQSRRAAPTLPTPAVMDEGVEKMPVPMMRPTLSERLANWLILTDFGRKPTSRRSWRRGPDAARGRHLLPLRGIVLLAGSVGS